MTENFHTEGEDLKARLIDERSDQEDPLARVYGINIRNQWINSKAVRDAVVAKANELLAELCRRAHIHGQDAKNHVAYTLHWMTWVRANLRGSPDDHKTVRERISKMTEPTVVLRTKFTQASQHPKQRFEGKLKVSLGKMMAEDVEADSMDTPRS